MNTRHNARGVPHGAPPPTGPLQVSTAPRPSDIRLSVHVAPGAPLGACEVQLGLGRGSKGKGQRPGDDHALHVAAVRRLAEDLKAYAHDLSAQKGGVTGARRWVDDGALSRCPERRPRELASARARNARDPALLRA